MKRGRLPEEGIVGLYSPDRVQQMLAEGMSEKSIQQLAKEKIKHWVHLTKARQHRQAAQQQLKGMPATGSENDAYDISEETTTPLQLLENHNHRLLGVKQLWIRLPCLRWPMRRCNGPSKMLKGFLGGPGAVPPLTNVRVGVVILTMAQQKWLGSGPMDRQKHQSYGWNVDDADNIEEGYNILS
uniref:Uncharacterized protein n=1 Tax=Romanomermis culicivorax TaxID=13658 RepID=A0A915IXI7_ROMCU